MNEPKPEVLYADIEDAQIEYLYYEGDGPALIMLHATGFLPWLWHPVARKLAGDYKIYAPYFCDHRITEPEEGGINWLTLASDLCDFCKQISVKNPFLVGHSMGATVMTIASAHYNSPAEKMIIIEPIFLPAQIYAANITIEQHPLASKSIKRRNKWADRSEVHSYLKSKPLFAAWDDEALDLYIQFGMVAGDAGGLTLTCSPRREAAMFMGGMQYNPWPVLDKITTPSLILEGELSENREYIDLQKAAALMPNGFFRQVEGAGHLIPMEKPAEIAGIIREFAK